MPTQHLHTSDEMADLEARMRGPWADLEMIAKLGIVTERFPESSEKTAIIEQAMTEELQKLSLGEREKSIFDVHGIALTHGEDPEYLESNLQELEEEIGKIRSKPEYDHAKYLNETYVTDRSFRLMFLRSDLFDTKLSAQRMVRHFKIKQELFGNGASL